MTTTKTARDIRNTRRPLSNRVYYIASRDVTHAEFINSVASATGTTGRMIITPEVDTSTMVRAHASKEEFGYAGDNPSTRGEKTGR